MINIKYIYIIINLIFYYNSCAQSIDSKKLFKNITNTVKNIQTVTYKIDRIDKHFTIKDTLNYSAICTLEIVDTDKIGSFYNITEKLNDSTYRKHKYDGMNVFHIYIQNDSLFSESFINENAKEKNYAYVNNNLKFLCNEFFLKSSGLIRNISSEKILVKEVVYQQNPTYELTFIHKNRKTADIINIVEKYYIDKVSFLPIGYVFTGEFEGMKGYESYNIKYLEINPKTSSQTFRMPFSAKDLILEDYFEEIKKYNL